MNMPSQSDFDTPIPAPISWQEALSQNLLSLQAQHPGSAPRIAMLGIGNELLGDDAAGVAVARALAPIFAGKDRFLIIEGGLAPENFSGNLRRFKPDLVLLIDAAQMNETPGTIRWLDWEETSGLSASTHTLPPYILSKYLTSELGCRVALLGIQPEKMDLEAPLSPCVSKAVESILREISSLTSK